MGNQIGNKVAFAGGSVQHNQVTIMTNVCHSTHDFGDHADAKDSVFFLSVFAV